MVSVLQQVNYNSNQCTAQCLTKVLSWIIQTSTKLFFVNNPVELSEVQKYLVTDLDKDFGCPITAAHLSVLKERVRHVFLQAHGEWLSTMLQNCKDFI